MKTIAFLRAVNVGGHNKVNMKQLVSEMEKNGFTSMKTYIQSGNILFDAAENAANRIEEIIKTAFGVSTKAVLRTVDELKEMLETNPYPPEKTYVTMLSGEPPEIPYVNGKGDEYTVIGRNAYLLVNGEYHKTVFSNVFFEKNTKLDSTTRNIKTVIEIINRWGEE